MRFGKSISRVNKTYNREKDCRVCSRNGYGVFGGQQKSRYGRGRLSSTRPSRYGRPTSSRSTKSRYGRQTSTRPSRHDPRLSREEQEHPRLRYPQKPSSRRSKSITQPIRPKQRPDKIPTYLQKQRLSYEPKRPRYGLKQVRYGREPEDYRQPRYNR